MIYVNIHFYGFIWYKTWFKGIVHAMLPIRFCKFERKNFIIMCQKKISLSLSRMWQIFTHWWVFFFPISPLCQISPCSAEMQSTGHTRKRKLRQNELLMQWARPWIPSNQMTEVDCWDLGRKLCAAFLISRPCWHKAAASLLPQNKGASYSRSVWFYCRCKQSPEPLSPASLSCMGK